MKVNGWTYDPAQQAWTAKVGKRPAGSSSRATRTTRPPSARRPSPDPPRPPSHYRKGARDDRQDLQHPRVRDRARPQAPRPGGWGFAPQGQRDNMDAWVWVNGTFTEARKRVPAGEWIVLP